MKPEEMYSDELKIRAEEGALVASGSPVRTLGEAADRWQRLLDFKQKYMIKAVDYGPAFPGSDKDVLHKPGAEKLAWLFGLRPEYVALTVVEDWTGANFGEGEPLFFYRYRCDLYDIESGKLVGSGIGSVNSWETKYRYSTVDASTWETMGQPAYVSKSVGTTKVWKFQYDQRSTTGKYARPEEYWQQIDAALESGQATIAYEVPHWTKDDKPAEVIYVPVAEYRIGNPRVFEQVNTFDKMAQKRAFLSAILVACGASALFTQDMEDWAGSQTPVWRPSWGEFYNDVLPVLPVLFPAEYTIQERVGLLASYLKEQYGLTTWQPDRAAELKVELLVDQRLKERAEAYEGSEAARPPAERMKFHFRK